MKDDTMMIEDFMRPNNWFARSEHEKYCNIVTTPMEQ